MVILSLPMAAGAQNEVDYELYMSKAQDASILFRGKQSMRYQMFYNGTYLWFSDGFERGDLVYNGKKYHGILMNIDAFRQELLIKHPNNVVTIVLNGDYVSDFDIGGKPFVRLSDKGYDNVKGYCQVLYKGSSAIYKQVEKRLESDVNLQNGDAIGYEDPNFRKGVYDFFSYRAIYYLEKDGVLNQVRGVSGLVKFYPEKRKEIKRFIRRNKGLYSKRFPDNFYVDVMNFIDSTR